MASSNKSKSSKIFVWIILLLLMVGLAGFGIGGFGGTIRTIGSVGKTDITVVEYQRALQQELTRASQARGAQISFPEALQIGLDQRVRSRLVALAALDEEARLMGLSVGDDEVARELQQVPQFRGIDGSFDREAYEFTLSQNGLRTDEFEESLREGAARAILQQAVTGGLTANPGYGRAVYGFLEEKRSFRWAPLDPALLVTGNATPTEAQLQAYYDENGDDFLTPEIRKISYAWLSPDMLLDTIDVDEDELRRLYDGRIAEFIQPERRLVERLGFETMEAALAAKAQIEAGETSFDDLVTGRGLTLDDVDLGEVAAADLDTAVAEVVFALGEPGVSAPVETSIGPALFRINAVLEANEITFEQARPELLTETTTDRARRVILDQIEGIDDLLAGGATLEELGTETEMQFGTLDYSAELAEGDESLAAYDEARAEILQATVEDFPEVRELSDGGIFALRLDEVIDPAVPSLDEIRDEVTAAWDATETQRRLSELGDSLQTQMKDGTAMEALGLTAQAEIDRTRNDFVEGAPVSLLEQVFRLDASGTALVEDGTTVVLVELTNISPANLDSEEAQTFLAALDDQASQGMAVDVFELFGQALQQRHGITLDQTAINAIHQQFQ
ncbi:MAG: peptidylprolyl isomerase [Litoreibacter sp.]|nr:peptidylprolyl isomerase [Litoreibacter sp.]